MKMLAVRRKCWWQHFVTPAFSPAFRSQDATNRTIELFKIPRALASGGGHPPPLIQLN